MNWKLAFCLCVILSACSNGKMETPALLGSLKTKFSAKEKTPTKEELRAAATNEILQSVGGVMILADIPKTGAVATLVPVAVNGPNITWMSADNIAIYTRDGAVVGTRGLGHDLMAADASGIVSALDSRSAIPDLERRHQYLTGEDGQETAIYRCSTSQVGPTKAREACAGDYDSFENFYEFDKKGDFQKMSQWVGPQIGYINIEYLLPK